MLPEYPSSETMWNLQDSPRISKTLQDPPRPLLFVLFVQTAGLHKIETDQLRLSMKLLSFKPHLTPI